MDRKVGASPVLGAAYTESKDSSSGDIYQQVNIQMNHKVDGKNSVDRIGEIFGELDASIGRALSPVRFRGGFSVSWRWCLFIAVCLIPDTNISAPLAIVWFLSLFVRWH